MEKKEKMMKNRKNKGGKENEQEGIFNRKLRKKDKQKPKEINDGEENNGRERMRK